MLTRYHGRDSREMQMIVDRISQEHKKRGVKGGGDFMQQALQTWV
jgi:hypothetical protein